jgi:4-diphosphocytidyl-2-C-methyl-D-erythritol kinase
VKLVARAPGKVNLCLFLGPVRGDGRHDVVTLLESVSLADEVTVTPASADEVVCPGVDELNIVTQTLDGLRARGWSGPRLHVTINKRIPVAAGMGGGSADAAAMLRLAAALAPVSHATVFEIAASLGADVPSQLRPGLVFATGAGDVIEALPPLPPHAFVIAPHDFGLSTAEVYREADRVGLPRDASDLDIRDRELRAALQNGTCLLGNDLEPAALSLRPEIGRGLEAVRDAGADHAMVSGSGPTVLGLFWGGEAEERAATAAGTLRDRYPRATSAAPVTEEFGRPRGT